MHEVAMMKHDLTEVKAYGFDPFSCGAADAYCEVDHCMLNRILTVREYLHAEKCSFVIPTMLEGSLSLIMQ